MNYQHIRDSLQTLSKQPLRFADASDGFLSWLRKTEYDAEIAKMLCACLLDTREPLGCVLEMHEGLIVERTEEVRSFGVSGFTAIGSTPNGDFGLLSNRDGSIHILDHELLPDETPIEKAFESLPDLLNAIIANPE